MGGALGDDFNQGESFVVEGFLDGVFGFLRFGGCPSGRARREKYGVGPDEAIPLETPDTESPEASSENDIT